MDTSTLGTLGILAIIAIPAILAIKHYGPRYLDSGRVSLANLSRVYQSLEKDALANRRQRDALCATICDLRVKLEQLAEELECRDC